MNYGYKIEVLEGYTFDKAIIFDKYAMDMFKIKQSHDSSDPMYLISKLLLNSLYGKFGMNIDLDEHTIIDSYLIFELIGNFNNDLLDTIDLGNGKSILSSPKDIGNNLNDITYMNVSIGIAAAITAYARIHMQQYLQDPNYNVYLVKLLEG